MLLDKRLAQVAPSIYENTDQPTYEDVTGSGTQSLSNPMYNNLAARANQPQQPVYSEIDDAFGFPSSPYDESMHGGGALDIRYRSDDYGA